MVEMKKINVGDYVIVTRSNYIEGMIGKIVEKISHDTLKLDLRPGYIEIYGKRFDFWTVNPAWVKKISKRDVFMSWTLSRFPYVRL